MPRPSLTDALRQQLSPRSPAPAKADRPQPDGETPHHTESTPSPAEPPTDTQPPADPTTPTTAQNEPAPQEGGARLSARAAVRARQAPRRAAAETAGRAVERGDAGLYRAAGVPADGELADAAVWSAIRAEWVAGIKTVPEIARQYGINKGTIAATAKRLGWPPRDDVRRAAREALTAETMKRAAERFVASDPARAAELPTDSGDPGDDSTVRAFAVVVADVIERQRATATHAVETGDALLADFQQNAAQLSERLADDVLGRRGLIAQLAGTYRTLVAGVSAAHQLQRQAYGLDAGDLGGGGNGDSASSSAAAGTGSYEDFVAAAEARGDRLT